LKKIEVFCSGIDNQSSVLKNRIVLVLAYMIFAYKDFGSKKEVLDRIVKNKNFLGVLTREKIIEVIFLCLDQNPV
ncbi:MAG: hypothetical protein LBD32_02105, partial [Cytophagales bacterium]|jgi:hypothetical protein|nr:hypothetical protein [Cytophagales bacterium]